MEQNERDTLKNNLFRMNAKITFLKANGETREMNCTLREEVMPPKKSSPLERKLSPDVLPVWDLDANGWRSFRYDSIIDVVYNIA
jgi:hypothetical protein